ncbi:MAG TPA: DinB family protein [Candidatus Limnocylindrales bacterium]|nr:DinB family protein [Candidatus Limnocylindrales bacterium]
MTTADRRAVDRLALAVDRLVAATVRLGDEEMGRPWAWGVYDEEGLRFALLMTHHELRDLAVRLESERARSGRAPSEAQRILAQYHEAHRDLTGALAGLGDPELDAVPAEGEWPVREALAHMLSADLGFRAVIRLARAAHARSVEPTEPSDEEWAAAVGDRSGLADGDVDAVRAGLARVHDAIVAELADIPDPELERSALFWDGAMPIRFRLHRFEEHYRQHTVQVDKTLLAIGRPPTEAERLARLVHGALARVESAWLAGVADGAVEDAATVIEGRAADLGAR